MPFSYHQLQQADLLMMVLRQIMLEIPLVKVTLDLHRVSLQTKVCMSFDFFHTSANSPFKSSNWNILLHIPSISSPHCPKKSTTIEPLIFPIVFFCFFQHFIGNHPQHFRQQPQLLKSLPSFLPPPLSL